MADMVSPLAPPNLDQHSPRTLDTQMGVGGLTSSTSLTSRKVCVAVCMHAILHVNVEHLVIMTPSLCLVIATCS